MSLYFVFGGQWGIVAVGIWAWAQLVSGSSVKRTALTRKSLTIWSTCNRENRNYCKCMTREHYGSLLMDVSLSQIQCCREMWLDLRLHPFSSWALLILAGRRVLMLARHRQSRLRVLPFSFSHTFGREMCVGNGTEVSNSNSIRRWEKTRYFERKGHEPELHTQCNR